MKKIKTADKRALLEEIEFFNTLTEEEKKVLLDHANVEIFPEDEIVVRKGEFAVDYYVVLDGEVEGLLIQQGKLESISRVVKGQCFGETAIIGKPHRETTYKTVSPTTVLRLDIPSLRRKKESLITKLLKNQASAMHDTIKNLKSEFANQLMEKGKVQSYYDTKSHSFYNKDNQLNAEDVNQLIKPKKLKLDVKGDPKSLGSSITARAGATTGEKAGGIKKALEESSERIAELERQSLKKLREEQESAEDISLEKYDDIIRKIYLQSDKLAIKIPQVVKNTIQKQIHQHLVGQSLSKKSINMLWSQNHFVAGTDKLKGAMHLVVLCPYGELAYRSAYPYLPFSHRVVGSSKNAVAGTFLSSNQEIEAYLNDDPINCALRLDRLMPIDRPKDAVKKQEEIGRVKDSQESWQQLEILTHTAKDVSDNTLFLVFDNEQGSYTNFLKQRFPRHQVVTVVRGFEYDPQDKSSLFSLPERKLGARGLLHDVETEGVKGFVKGSTYFLADLSPCYQQQGSMDFAFVFATISILADMAQEVSDVAWGSSGGTSGVLKAVRILYGNRGPQNIKDVEAAVKWADKLKSKK